MVWTPTKEPTMTRPATRARLALAAAVAATGLAAAAPAGATVPLAVQQQADATAKQVFPVARERQVIVGVTWGASDSIDADLRADRPNVRPSGYYDPESQTTVMDAEITNPYEYCVVRVHERGHAAGEAHAAEGVMSRIAPIMAPYAPCLAMGSPLRNEDLRGDTARPTFPLGLTESLDAARRTADDFRRDFTEKRVRARCEVRPATPERRRCWVRWRNDRGHLVRWQGVMVKRTITLGRLTTEGRRSRALDALA